MKSVFFGILVLLLVGCDSSEHSDAQEIVSNVQTEPFDEIEIETDFAINQKAGIYNFNDGEGEFLVLLDSALTHLHFLNIWTGEAAEKHSVDSIFQLFKHSYSLSVCINSRDSVFFLLDESTLVLTNLETGDFESWKFDTTFADYPEFLIFGLGNMMGFTVQDQLLICKPTIQSIRTSTAETRQVAYSYPSHFAIRLFPNGRYALEWAAGESPEHLRNGVGYNDDLPTATAILNETFVVSYDHEHQLHLHDVATGKRLKTATAKAENYKQLAPFNDDSIGNMNYTRTYLLESSSYKKVLHDPFSGNYFRVHWQGVKLERDQYEINGILDKPWSLLVFDDELNALPALNFSSSKDYSFGSIVPTTKGLLIRQGMPQSRKLRYGLFKP